jgi:membrane-associated phospholipid phosphatase
MRYLESRQGYLLYDPILELLPSVDVSIHIMVIMNLVTIPTIIFLLGRPYLLIKGLLAFNILLLLRYTVLYLVPLEAPIGYLPLTDPFLDTFIYRNGNISKDLFFSGHTAFMFLAYLLAPNQVLKISNFIGFLSIGILLMIQHVHYSYDVLAAPFFSLLAYYSSYYFFERYLVIKSKITS